MAGFPPRPTYPLQIDSDRTLYKVYNTTETRLAANNSAWSDEIVIVPVADDAMEIWGDNGYGNIEGELFYYDSVEKNGSDKIFKLKRCIRNLSGRTKHNNAGTWVRSFVVGEHHNQLAEVIFKTQDVLFDMISDIEDLLEEPITASDCPEINFQFVVDADASSKTTGTVVDYDVEVKGIFTSFRIDFGDGHSSTLRSGTHTYVPNSNIDPVVVVDNNICSIIITPSGRDLSLEPQPETPDNTFLIPIPDPIDIPNFNFSFPDIPETTLTFPPIIPPCLDLGPLGPINVPSVISIRPPINIPSRITFGPVSIPTLITFGNVPNTFPTLIRFASVPSIPTLIRFGNVPSLPTLIRFSNVPSFPTLITVVGGADFNFPSKIVITGPKIPNKITVNITGKIPSKITITGKIPSKITITGKIPSKISFGKAPTVSVKWGKPPSVSVIIKCPTGGGGGGLRLNNEPNQNADLQSLTSNQLDNMDFDIGLPSEIKILAPKDLPKEIKITSEGLNLPSEIKVIGNIPNEIKLTHSLPTEIRVKSKIPSVIRFEGAEKIPKVISIAMPKAWPKIAIDASAIPETIRLVGNIPSTITVKSEIPTEIIARIQQPEPIKLIYEGGPIPLQFDKRPFGGGDDDLPCFALVPCPKK